MAAKKPSRLSILPLLPILGALFLAGFILYVLGDRKRATYSTQKTRETNREKIKLKLKEK
jgi:hypothetical protein